MVYLLQTASQVGALDIGYKAGIEDLSRTKFLYLLGAVSSVLIEEHSLTLHVYLPHISPPTLPPSLPHPSLSPPGQ